ncbi:hypothetical protein QFZ65_001454 [Arthrobacter sp. B3I9]|uniref:hypothetical protein n=1 Tax=Arthrobacter sp. B3I9 TaxID=3042270 RepID=UPI00279506EB|nr:hypothetical protein [Arthrobacter sp. B3I9]MDQ0849516.1 hypothetical protein [Arthrobacter sp. B3I9]
MAGPEIPAPAQVTATALGPWPGEDPLEAARIIRGELGSPHLPFLAELPDRGVGSDALGRTASLLVELAVDVQPHGWRIVDRPGRDLMRARSALSTDINILADVIGAEDAPAAELKVQLRGPLSLAAGLHLHNGERALIDYGARRDIAASLAAGVGGYLKRVAAAAPGARLVVQIDEPEIASVLAGTIPTSSGYRTLRSVPGQEATDSWQLLVDALRAAGAAEIAVAVPEIEAPFDRILASGADAIAVPLRALTSRQWEQLAGAVEAGRRLWAGALDVGSPSGALPRVADAVETVWRPWRQLGLPASTLGALRVTPAEGLERHSPSSATAVLTRLTQLADGLNQLALG